MPVCSDSMIIPDPRTEGATGAGDSTSGAAILSSLPGQKGEVPVRVQLVWHIERTV